MVWFNPRAPFASGACHRHRTSKILWLVPPGATGKFTHAPHFGQRPVYAVPAAFLVARPYAWAQLNHSPRNLRPLPA